MAARLRGIFDAIGISFRLLFSKDGFSKQRIEQISQKADIILIELLFYLFLTAIIISVTHKLASSGKKSGYYWLGSGAIILSGAPVLIYFFL